MKKLYLIIIFLLFTIKLYPDEFRGIWALATYETQASPEYYEQLFDNLSDHNFNNLMFYTVLYGMANYPSSFVPWNINLTGQIGQNPGWDPLETGIKMARDRGILIHVKLNIFLAWKVNNPLPDSPLHPLNAHPDWILVGRDGRMMTNIGEHLFFNPCHPEVQDWIYNYTMEIVSKYGIDGIHLDYIRFPNPGYSWDPVTLNRFWARFGKSPDDLPNEWIQWRKDQITNLIIRIKTMVRRLRWNVIFGADVLANRTTGINYCLQDMEEWRKRKILDFDVPMLYTTDLSTFQSQLQDHLDHSHGRFVFSGIGAYLMGGNTDNLDEQITLSGDLATSGVMIFKYVSLFPDNSPNVMADYLKANLFQNSTQSIIYPWKTKTESDPPSFEGLKVAESRNNMAVLRWKPATDSTLPITYNIYQSMVSGEEGFTTPTYSTQDTVYLVERLCNETTYHFVVRSEDEFANEDVNTIELNVTPSESHDFILEDFESGSNSYWNGIEGTGIIFQNPLNSPYTTGLDSASTLTIRGDLAHSGIYSGDLALKWTDTVNGQCFLETSPQAPMCPDFTAWFHLRVYGENDGTRIAAIFRDETGFERTPFIIIDWNGWKKVEWFLPETKFAGWNGGNGELSGGIFGGEFSGLLILPGNTAESNLLLDDIGNHIRTDDRPPQFAGLESVTSMTGAVGLKWRMAMDASNPITYHIYMSSAPDDFDFTTPTASTTNLEHDLEIVLNPPLYFIVRAQDRYGNEDNNLVIKASGPGQKEILENFESGLSSYWNGNHNQGIIFQDPNYSGSTAGVDITSRWEIVTSPTMQGQYAGKLYVKWTDLSGGFCRVTTHSIRPVIENLNVVLTVWIYGTGDNTQLSMNLVDDLREGGHGQEYEQTPYITIDWKGWRQVRWDFDKVDWISWRGFGTGALEDPLAGAHFDGFFLLPGEKTEISLYFDDFVIASTFVLPVSSWALH